MKKTSWFLSKNINDVRNIFEDQILLYEVDCFFCSCGHNKIFLKSINSNIDKYICENCDNATFLEASKYSNNYLWYEPITDLLNENFILSLNPNIYFEGKDRILKATISLNIPNSYDLAADKIIYKSKELFKLQLDEFENINQLLLVNFDLKSYITKNEKKFYDYVSDEELISRNPLLNEFKKKILEAFKEYSNNFKSKICNKSNSLEAFAFFIHNYHLLDLDFYKWKNIELLPNDKYISILEAMDFILNYRSEKTLKKTVINNYKMQIREYSCYNCIYIYSIVRYIKDVNILNRMINIDIKKSIDELIDQLDLYIFIQFLSTKFSDKQIEKLFLSYEKEEMFWLIDSVTLFSEIKDYLDDFQVSKCRFDVLHQNIIDYHRVILNKHLFEVTFDYENKFLNACANIENYSIKLPKNGLELYNWSNALQNCLSGYWNLIKDKKTVVYGFFINNEIKFAVEIRNNKIIQSKSKYNRDLQNKEMSLVQGWFKEYFEGRLDSVNCWE